MMMEQRQCFCLDQVWQDNAEQSKHQRDMSAQAETDHCVRSVCL